MNRTLILRWLAFGCLAASLTILVSGDARTTTKPAAAAQPDR